MRRTGSKGAWLYSTYDSVEMFMRHAIRSLLQEIQRGINVCHAFVVSVKQLE